MDSPYTPLNTVLRRRGQSLFTASAHLLFLLFLVFATPASAQSGDMPASPPLQNRAAQLVDLLRSPDTFKAEDYFAPSFLAEVPASDIRALAKRIIRQNGPVTRLEAVSANSATSGNAAISTAKADLRFDLNLAPGIVGRVIGFRLTSVQVRGDTPAALSADMRALPGKAGLLIRRLNSPAVAPVLAANAEREFAVGSGFKLWVLAEAAQQVQSGTRTWSDVIPLGPPSLPSGMTQNWPIGTAMTLQSLANLMISISDNTTTDTLLKSLGRDEVDAVLARTGHAHNSKALPVLTTLEAFALKMDGNADLRARWIKASRAERLALITANPARLSLSAIDRAQLAGAPRFTDSIEWFATPQDMVGTLDWLRENGGKEALDILAINPGLLSGEAARFSYIGYKGGSEIGVIAMNFLVRTKAGAWYGVSGSWNNPLAGVDHEQFEALMSRALWMVSP
jgi:beta-lactamase class A